MGGLLLGPRLMRHIQKARELKNSMSSGESLGTEKAASSSSSGSTESVRKKNGGFFSGWMKKSKPQPTPTPAPASALGVTSEPISKSPLLRAATEDRKSSVSETLAPLVEQNKASSSFSEGSGKAKRYAAFLSHDAVETADESQLVMEKLVHLLPPENNARFRSNDDSMNISDCADHVCNLLSFSSF